MGSAARRPSVAGYVIAGLLAVAGTVVGVILIVTSVVTYVDRVQDFQRVPVGTVGTFALEDGGGYTVYYEGDGVAAGNRPMLPVRITDDLEEPVTVEPYGSKVTYEVSGHEGVAIGSFHADRPGTFTINSTDTAGSGTLAVGRGLGRTVVRQAFLGVGVIGLALLLAGALATWTLLARARTT